MMPMMPSVSQGNNQALRLDGSRTSGKDIRTQNVTACLAIANIVKSSLGPEGLDKMLVDDIGDFMVTNDGASILKQLDVEHPAAKVLVDLAQLQDDEVGDGTTSVVLVAAELLKRANTLVSNNIHPTNIIAGYRIAAREATRYIKRTLSLKTDSISRETLINCAKTSMSSKIIGYEADFFAELVVDAVSAVKTINSKGEEKYPIKAINMLKQYGQSSKDSRRVNGFALNCRKASQGMPTYVKNAKIALLDFDLTKSKMKMGIKINVNDPKELEAIREREVTITKERIQKILDAGANVVFTTRGIDDLNAKYFVEAGVMAVRRCDKTDLKRIAKLTGGSLCVSMADLEGGESFDPSYLGQAEEVSQEYVGDDELIFIRGCANTTSQSIILRGPNTYMLDEMYRSMHDAICVVKRVLESKYVVAGGGAVETSLSIYLENFATTLDTREQLAIAEFAEALLVIPKTLAVNAAADATDLVAKLRACHNASQTDSDKKEELMNMGLDLFNGKVRNNLKAGVLEPALGKVKSLKFATEAAITILRIDDMIRLNPKEDEEQQQRGGGGGMMPGMM